MKIGNLTFVLIYIATHKVSKYLYVKMYDILKPRCQKKIIQLTKKKCILFYCLSTVRVISSLLYSLKDKKKCGMSGLRGVRN